VALKTDRIDTVWDAELEPDFRQYVIATARHVLAEEQTRGFDKDPLTIVDNKWNAPVEGVKTFGQIQFHARADLGEVIDWIFRRVVERSPVLTGRYVQQHHVLVNGAEASPERWKTVKAGDRIQFVNAAPYAKKIEGRDKGRGGAAAVKGQSLQAPNGVYRAVYREAQRRFGKLVFLDFTYVKLNLGVQVWKNVNYYVRKDGTKSAGSYKRVAMVYPCIKLYQAP
jgi:hypothetical protein